MLFIMRRVNGRTHISSVALNLVYNRTLLYVHNHTYEVVLPLSVVAA